VYKAFGRGDLGSSIRRLLFRCSSGKARRRRRRSVTVRLGLGHPGPFELCLADCRWCAETRKGTGSLVAEVLRLATLLIVPNHVPDFPRAHPISSVTVILIADVKSRPLIIEAVQYLPLPLILFRCLHWRLTPRMHVISVTFHRLMSVILTFVDCRSASGECHQDVPDECVRNKSLRSLSGK